MLVNLQSPCWWYMEIPRTGSTAVDRGLRRDFPKAKAAYPKHWPVFAPAGLHNVAPVTAIRNPYSRAVSCWQFFTKPDSISFVDWLRQKEQDGFFDVGMEARPQSFWFNLANWHYVLRQEHLDDDYAAMCAQLIPQVSISKLPVINETNGLWVNKVRAKPKREKPWQGYYCAQSIELVKKIYASDFAAFKRFYTVDFPNKPS